VCCQGESCAVFCFRPLGCLSPPVTRAAGRCSRRCSRSAHAPHALSLGAVYLLSIWCRQVGGGTEEGRRGTPWAAQALPCCTISMGLKTPPPPGPRTSSSFLLRSVFCPFSSGLRPASHALAHLFTPPVCPHLFTPPTLVLLLLGFLSPWLYSSPPPEAVISVVCCMPCMNHFLLRCLGGEGDSV